jgi:hypothetical protein
MRFLLYGSRGLIDANLPGLSAVRDRLRLIDRDPAGASGMHVLVFDAETDGYLGRRDILLDGDEPVLVSPALGC